jgi:lysophospholipase L1-like esterase
MKRLAFIALGVVLAGCASVDSAASIQGASGWAGAWGASPTVPPTGGKTFENQTVRQVIRISSSGSAVRIRFTNEYGEKPLEIGAATLSLAGPDGKPTGAIKPITFAGNNAITIPPGAPMLSDPVTLDAKALDQLSISIFLPTATGPCTCHFAGTATAFVSQLGNFTQADFEPASTFTNRAFISGVEVSRADPQTIVAFGDSITDGTASTVNGNKRWPDVLAERLNAAGNPRPISNQAIAGNRVLSWQSPIFGEPALTRFDRDVLSVPNARWLVILEGINDIGMGAATPPSAAQIIAGYRQMIDRAEAKGMKVYIATLLPYEGARYHQEAGEAVRNQVNAWIRSNTEAAGFIDFDAAMRDPANPKKMKADLQSGDWLHPNDAGYKVMGDAVDLALFK